MVYFRHSDPQIRGKKREKNYKNKAVQNVREHFFLQK